VVSPVALEEVLARLKPEDRQGVEEFRDSVRRHFGPRLRDLRLFGSKARGDDHEESDIDVLVLLDGCESRDRDAVWDLATSVSFTLMPVISDFEAYHAPRSRASGFYEELRRESVRL
jgi:predicted nucleotidyltransferase